MIEQTKNVDEGLVVEKTVTESFSDWENAVNSVELPSWLIERVSPMPPIRKISHAEDGTFLIVDEFGEVLSSGFPSFLEAYRSVDHQNGEFEVVVSDTVYADGIENIGGLLFLGVEQDGGSQVLTLGHYENSMLLLNHAYYNWINVVHPRWLADPNDWVNAYTWLELHPVFWIRDSAEPTIDWVTDNGLSTAWKSVRANEDDGKPEILLEHGPHHEPDFTECSLDHQLDSWGETFEECYIKLAKKVHENYDKTGEARCSSWLCTDLDEDENDEESDEEGFEISDSCQKHLSIHRELKEKADDPHWATLVEQVWAVSDAS